MTSFTSSSKIKQHDADLAGGAKEVVFSCDGADAVPVAFPVATIMTDEENRLDASEIMTAEEAFEVFAGKLYVTNPYINKKNLVIGESKESPLERLARLKRELEELEQDCTSKVESSLFQDQLVKLQEQLHRLSSSQLQQPAYLLASIQTAVTDLNSPLENTSVTDDSATTSALQLETRLRRLETALGGTSSSSGGSLLDRVHALEQVHSKLDDKKLDVLQKRGKVIRQDLEAAAKARNKIASSLVSAEDSKTIAALYDQMQQLSGLSAHLPALTARLQELAHQHIDAATRATRFSAVEQVVATLSPQVQSMETTLSTMETTLQRNAAAMQENVASLEERIKLLM